MLIYGCNLAGDAEGQLLVESLAELTGADVAASANDTGSSLRGGDWQLEYVTGSIETTKPLSVECQAVYQGLLASDGDLQVTLQTAPNFVVDSNDPTSGPSTAFITATFTNTGSDTLTDVFAYIGNFIDGVNDTAGVYETRTHTGLTGTFSLTHEGGTAGQNDAIRYIGDLQAGQSVVQYWLVSYPKVDDNGDSVVGGVKANDDLFVQYDVWATASGAIDGDLTAVEAGTAYMRSEISASANKIWPNGTNKVPQEYLDAISSQLGWSTSGESSPYGTLGTLVTSEGIWYDLGNVGDGFDNDGDFVPDSNVFLQPVGDPSSFDAGTFRLVHSYGLIIVKLKGGGEQLIAFEDNLYHTHLPDNTGAVGLVFYDYIALGAETSSLVTPYQEVASGKDNEKYSSDYGTTALLVSGATGAAIDKTVDITSITSGSTTTLTYTIDITNNGTDSIGTNAYGSYVVIEDAIPAGTSYVLGSAAAGNTLPAGVSAYRILYSTDNGGTWSTEEPADPALVTTIQWWLDAPLDPSQTAEVTFQVVTDASFTGVLIDNTAEFNISGGSAVYTDHATTRVDGTNQITGVVFYDNGDGSGAIGDGIQNGTEAGLTSITVFAYIDTNNDGLLDSGDYLWDSVATDVTGNYLFDSLPDASFLVAVQRDDANRPAGSTLSTEAAIAVTLASSNGSADFGYAPSTTALS